ncbi:MAG: LD-carboxypeptidase [Bacteroidaceae bacterium]|nr:LD-carboxypeptidase [Bacteroidaceae bacterium]
MKRLFEMITGWVLAVLPMSAQQMIKPKPLQPGDKVVILSPSSTPDESYVVAAEQVLGDWGFVTQRGEHLLHRVNGNYAGTPQQRLDDLLSALNDPDVKAIFCSRGGHGAVQEIQRLSPEIIRNNPKWLIGFSDITAAHGAWQSAGVMSIHGPMGAHLQRKQGTDEESQFLRKMLQGEAVAYSFPGHELNQAGEVTGTLFGGNLAVYNDITATPLDCVSHLGADVPLVLFIEEVGESFERVNRMINHLKLLGLFHRVKAVIVGEFTDYEATGAWPSMEHMIAEQLQEYDIPIAFGFPAGHGELNYPLMMGAKVSLSVSREELKLQFLY